MNFNKLDKNIGKNPRKQSLLGNLLIDPINNIKKASQSTDPYDDPTCFSTKIISMLENMNYKYVLIVCVFIFILSSRFTVLS